MKKNAILLIFIVGTLFTPLCKGQYTVILNSNCNGLSSSGNLYGTPTLIGHKLYAMQELAGGGNYGSIFSVNTNGTGYNTVVAFNGTDGAFPTGNSVTLSGALLYGMTTYGGPNPSYGNIFSVDTDGTGFTNLHYFNDTNGGTPTGSLIVSGNTLFGMTKEGGESTNPSVKFQDGCIFSIKTNGNGYKVIHYFNDTNGAYPYGTLILSGGVLYGMTEGGGSGGQGVIFSIDTNGSNYTILHAFLGASDGQIPQGNLVISTSGRILYGQTATNCFSIHIDGSSYTTFGPGSVNPGSLLLSSGYLYGMTQTGGANNQGTIFSIDTNGNGYLDIHDFEQNAVDSLGENPQQSSLIISGSILYGMAYGGGFYQNGVVFSCVRDSLSGINELPSAINYLKIFPNPSSGLFTLQLTDGNLTGNNNTVQIYNTLGEIVSIQKLQNTGDKNIDLSMQPNGVYFCRVFSEDGTLIGQGKLVLQK
jgi:uncharacterized repeat protein (TIGR03803 family)